MPRIPLLKKYFGEKREQGGTEREKKKRKSEKVHCKGMHLEP